MNELSDSLAHPELVFGLVAPIGVDMDEVQGQLNNALTQVGYGSDLIHLSHVLSNYLQNSSGKSDASYNAKIDRANTFCEGVEHPGAMAALAVLEVRRLRQKYLPPESTEIVQVPRRAYIIRQLKRRAEVELLRQVYGEKFIQLSVSVSKEERVHNLTHVLLRRDATLSHSEAEAEARKLVEVDDHQEGKKFGQEVGDIFHQADFFLSGENSARISTGLNSFVKAFFGDNSKSPNKKEYGAYLASTAALRSADLSRQVGAAIISAEGDVITLGCNEVPKAFGGNYWSDDEVLARDFEFGAEQNAVEKRRIILDFISRLSTSGILQSSPDVKDPEFQERVSLAVEDALVSEITEYGRMVHAEMNAVCDAARLGRSVRGSTIFVTTFPCHNCAKHIVASGIARVVYIEPYPKSRALTSHPDSVSLSKGDASKVIFEHFEGISPRRYREIFQKGKRRSGNKINKWYENDEPRPRISQREDVHIGREGIAVDAVLGKFLQGARNQK